MTAAVSSLPAGGSQDRGAAEPGMAAAPRPDTWHWRDDAACLDTDPDIWFPPQGSNSREAKRICSGCPVLTQCRQWAMTLDNDVTGIIAGLTYKERRALRGRWTRPLKPILHGTTTGYDAHRRRGIPMCLECRLAMTAYVRERKAQATA